MTSIFRKPWPEDLPQSCPTCGHSFTVTSNIVVGPGKSGRLLRSCAYWGMVPWSVLSWVFLGAGCVAHFNSSGPGGLAMVGFFLLPVIIFMPIALFMPNSRRVRCYKCGYDKDFKALLRKRDCLVATSSSTNPPKPRNHQTSEHLLNSTSAESSAS
jgi:hypothetical protein